MQKYNNNEKGNRVRITFQHYLDIIVNVYNMMHFDLEKNVILIGLERDFQMPSVKVSPSNTCQGICTVLE